MRLCHADPKWAYLNHFGEKVLPEIPRTRLRQVPFQLARYTFLLGPYAPHWYGRFKGISKARLLLTCVNCISSIPSSVNQ